MERALQADRREVVMWHLVARAVRGRWLFATWAEGLEVWDAVWRAVPDAEAVCVMPDHLHVLAPHDGRRPLAAALAGVTRRRNGAEGRTGPLLRPLPPAVQVPSGPKRRRSVRYVHLNPCRAGLVGDPLAWPLSTHRDAVGLTLARRGPLRRREAFHAYVSADPATRVTGTPLPGGRLSVDDPEEVLTAVSSVLRVPRETLGRVPRARALAEAAFGELHPISRRRLAAHLGITDRTLRRTPPVDRLALDPVRRVVGDPRFEPLDGLGLTGLPAWQRYGQRRGLPRWRP